MWFQKLTTKIAYNKLSEEIKQQWEDCELDTSDEITVCITCKRNLMSNKIPKLSLINALGFPEIPEVLQNLTPLESRNFSSFTFYANETFRHR